VSAGAGQGEHRADDGRRTPIPDAYDATAEEAWLLDRLTPGRLDPEAAASVAMLRAEVAWRLRSEQRPVGCDDVARGGLDALRARVRAVEITLDRVRAAVLALDDELDQLRTPGP
jgi:hypothetical protein